MGSPWCLRGGSSADEAEYTDMIESVELLEFDTSAILWRERGHGSLHMYNLSTGEPSIAFFLGPAKDTAAAPGDQETGAATNTATLKDTPWLSHALWELIDYEPLAAISTALSVAYDLPAQHATLVAGCKPEHSSMIGWRFQNEAAADRFQQTLLGVQARLRHQRYERYQRSRAARARRQYPPPIAHRRPLYTDTAHPVSAAPHTYDSDDVVTKMMGEGGGDTPRRRLQKNWEGWKPVEEHGLDARELAIMMEMQVEPLDETGVDTEVCVRVCVCGCVRVRACVHVFVCV